MKALALVFALVCSTAMADGVPMITPGPAVSRTIQANLLNERKDFVRIIPVNVNRQGFGANLVTVVLDGKTYTFVGELRPNPNKNIQSWFGVDSKNASRLTMTYSPSSGFMGASLLIGATKHYDLVTRGGRDMLLEPNSNFRTSKRETMIQGRTQ